VGSVSTDVETDVPGLASRLAPRDDALVLEVPAGPPGPDPGEPSGSRAFDAAAGPFRAYRRTVTWTSGTTPDRRAVHQDVEWTHSFPYWGWLYRPLLRRTLPDGVPPGVRPWWSFPDRLSPRQSTVVATMALFNVVAGMLFGILTQVLTFADADIGNGSSGQQATVFAVVRIGVVVTMVAMVLADKVGRRRVALWSFGLAAALTVATAAAPNLVVLTGLQLLSRNLAIAGLLAVDTISVEELPAGSRAMASGLGAMAYGLGAGIAVVSLPLADLGPAGWRLTFLLAVVTVPLLRSGSRFLPESGRFTAMRAEEPTVEGRRIRGGRFALLAGMFFLLNMFVAPASQLQNDYLRADRGFSGSTITLFVILTGTPGAIGVIVGGRWADSRGRRTALIPGLLAVGIFNAVFFSVAGVPMWVASLLGSMLGGLCVAALGVLGPELFPTARRGGARGALTVIAVVGSVVGLLAAGVGVDRSGYGPTFVLLALGPIVAAGMAFAVPETSRRELEDINRPDG
jgi:predicted MFS family arabinose efflux permease